MLSKDSLLSSVVRLQRLGFEAEASEEVNILGGKSVSYYNNIRTYNNAFAITSEPDGFLVLFNKDERKFSSLTEATNYLARVLVESCFNSISVAEARKKELCCEYCYLPDEDGHCYTCGDDKDLFNDDGTVLCRQHVLSYVGGKEKLEAIGQKLSSE
jgi:hypothetical protein